MSTPTRQMQEVLDAHAAMGPLPIETLDAELARQIPLVDRAALAVYGQHITRRALAPMPQPVGEVRHKRVAGHMHDVLVRLYYPAGDPPEDGWPVLVYYHGGGWVIASLDTYDASCRALCVAAECLVVSAHYRQAPEHPWPAATEDALTAYQWAVQHAASFGGNPAMVAVAGESAGGNLAAVVSQMTRDQRFQRPVHQLLIYPVTDLIGGQNSDAAKQHEDARPLNRAMLNWFYDKYAPPDINREHAYVSPLHASDLSGLPPATIINAEIDPLRDDGEAYAQLLERAGVSVKHQVYPGVTHEFFGMQGLVDEAGDALELAAARLREAFTQTTAGARR